MDQQCLAGDRPPGHAGTAIVDVVFCKSVKHSWVDGQRPPMLCVYNLRFLTWSKAAAGAIMIRLPRLTSTSVLAVLMPLVLASQGFGQSLVGGQSALDNAAAAGARSPGNMVSAGVGQHIDFGNHVTVITEPGSSNEGLLAQTIASSLEVLFQQLNQALVVFQNLLLARAGRPPALSGITLKAARTEEPRPGNLVNTAQRQVKARRSLR